MRLFVFLLLISFNVSAVTVYDIKSHAIANSATIQVNGFSIGKNIPSESIMAAPPADAFRGMLYGYEVAVYHNEVFPASEYGYRALVKLNGDWAYLDEPTYFASELKNRQDCYDVAAVLVSTISATAYDVLKPDDGGSVEPDFGAELMAWILNNKAAVVNDEIVIN